MVVEIFENVFNDDVRHLCLKIRNETQPYSNDSGIYQYAIGSKPVRNYLKPILKEILAPLGVKLGKHGSIRQMFRPYGIHIDGRTAELDINIIYKRIVLIPLEINPTDGDAYTIFFDQMDLSDDITSGHRTYAASNTKSDDPKRISDYSKLEDIRDKPFDREIYERYLNHIKYEHLAGLSIHRIVKWKFGDVVCFEPTRLHATASFKTNNTLNKTHIIYKAFE